MAFPYASNIITGTIDDSDVLATKKVPDFTPGLWMLYEKNDLAPLVSFQMELRNRSGSTRSTKANSKNPKHQWHYKDLFPRWDTVSGSISNNGTAAITFAPTAPTRYAKGDLVEFFPSTDGNTNHGIVTTEGASTIIVTSIDGSTTLPTIAAGDQIHLISMAAGGASNSPTGRHPQAAADWNYPQYLRYPTVLDIYEMDEEHYTGPERDERVDEQLSEIKMSWERALLFGERGTGADTADGTRYSMRGIKRFIEANAGDNILDWSGGSLSQDQWDEWLVEGPLKTGSQFRLFFPSTELMLKLHSWEKDKKRIQGKVSHLGIAFTEYLAPNNKTLFITHHHMFEEAYEGAGQIVDPKFIDILPYGRNKIFGFFDNTQANDFSGQRFEWRMLATLEVGRVEPHGWIHQ